MTLETINKALQHTFKIRDPTTLTLKSVTDATIANLTALKEDATASAIKITSLEGEIATLTSTQRALLAPLEADMEASQFEVSALKADIVELKKGNAEKEKQIVALDGAMTSFVTGFKAVSGVHHERKAAKMGSGLPSPTGLESPTKFSSPMKLESPTKFLKPKKSSSPTKFA